MLVGTKQVACRGELTFCCKLLISSNSVNPADVNLYPFAPDCETFIKIKAVSAGCFGHLGSTFLFGCSSLAVIRIDALRSVTLEQFCSKPNITPTKHDVRPKHPVLVRNHAEPPDCLADPLDL
ncbi:hypothetical protein [Bradyrhizobium sp. CCGUVB14]|uniref:hypothetical protein n=1 Tax=Bradyrhizobium sp. CCGUVB14 TaxID=2949628 RepID=UPI0020B42642|nr:hypothetical protein [Bradyrhizobium sp. CCGUVB14]MCP3441420.1 hypothetical protein [Bradyrhizobium sp. CCGUVB14]